MSSETIDNQSEIFNIATKYKSIVISDLKFNQIKSRASQYDIRLVPLYVIPDFKINPIKSHLRICIFENIFNHVCKI